MEEIENPFLKLLSLPFVHKLHYFGSIESTNTFAKSLTDFSDSGLTVVIAKSQTAGRGQRGNSFFSCEPGGIFATIVCPVTTVENHFIYNRAICLSIVDAVKAVYPDAPLAIKWPNDVYWSAKKICGILLESTVFSDKHLIIGFGINVNIRIENFPHDIQNIATSLFSETGKTTELSDLLCDIVKRFEKFKTIPADDAHEIYGKLLYKIGSPIEISDIRGILSGVLPDGRLVVETDAGKEFRISGTVRFL